jgi:hypothetical protein
MTTNPNSSRRIPIPTFKTRVAKGNRMTTGYPVAVASVIREC